MRMFNVALLQLTSRGSDQAASLRKGDTFCRRAAATGADLALFPEMWSNGYARADRNDQAAYDTWLREAISIDDPFITHFRDLARELEMAIAITYLERWDGGPRNTVSVIDRTGGIVLTYAKAHTCEFGLECSLNAKRGATHTAGRACMAIS